MADVKGDQQYEEIRPLLEENSAETYASINDNVPTSDDGSKCRAYKRRWYIVGIFSLFASTQCAIGNTWGPIADSAGVVLGWTDSNIALVNNCGCFSYILLAVPFSWLLDVKGLRTSVLLAAFFMTLGTGMRCFTLEEPVATWLIYLGQFFNGCGAPVMMAAPPLISATWFPPEQRTTATAIAGLLGNVGCALSYVIGPLAVYQPEEVTNHTRNHSNALIRFSRVWFDGCTVSRHCYVLTEFGLTAMLFLAIVVYYPACPPSPPSLSASISRLNFVSGVKGLVTNGTFWLVCLSYGMVQGTFGGWGNILDVNVSPYNVTQVQAGWVGFYGNLIGCASSFVLARLGDYFAGHFKLMLVLLALLQAGTMLWFTFMVNVSLIPFNMASLYTTFSLTQVCLSGSAPIFYEMSAELTYPVAEGITTMVLTLVYYIFCLLVLFLPMIPFLGVTWVNWTTLGATFVVIPMLCCFRERYGRLSIDMAAIKGKDIITDSVNQIE
ncbi:solute carrier family 49 member 4 homolog [Branchiostoma floridae]|uniref:Solute carrier family 49 member 4 homolog n=1 Tax=Branchiostoma floridae TaxID=7739 RepID=A0A9J7MS16_BRAFL|nr:solute carrier family 49 member 4 homolog [Branchiostoma floridae]